jgi:MurNAc alpha-1-phosphate uridylyltransferase
MKKAMILAAGRGERMGELTKAVPKPLLRVGEYALIEHTIFRLHATGIDDIVINVSYLGEQIKQALGDGSRYGVQIVYSEEKERLETGGGIVQALPLLGDEPFLVVSSDILTDYPFRKLLPAPQGLAHLVMVPNPPYHLKGDYGLVAGKLTRNSHLNLTYANIGVYRPEMFTGYQRGHFRLSTVLNPAIEAGLVSGESYDGSWHNIGTPADLMKANVILSDV